MYEIWVANSAVAQTDGILYDNNLDTDVYIAALYTQTLPVVRNGLQAEKG
jgi:hypothetical protein